MAAFTTTAVERFIRGGVPMGKPHAIFPGRERPLPAAPAFGGGPGSSSTACVGLGRRGRKRRSRSAHGLQSTCARRPRKQDGSREKSQAGRDPRADIRETKRRERAVVGAPSTITSMDHESPVAEGADDDVGAATGSQPSLAARPCGTRPRGPDRRHRADRAQRQGWRST